ncbi:MAG: tRNA (adenosine(37)-N6)-threonylcarbamoyltransferase complex dimerization subunit type 1 TsaB [Ruminococcaceae bacterium]|nr:tRNA (adenosine(37)-N6)-threonylcarbamoyltransferase complex dimerization subunit type 1 TsaB [Oscillospiraceae bacterium]
MKILAIECSATPASVAVLDGDKLLASAFVNVKLTHSQTLMPMIESTLKAAKININDIEGFAISNGPGSFTGVRIGISAVKGLAAAKKLPCVAVSTLYAMAQNYSDTDCIVCAVMDARCNQLYNAIFDIQNGKIARLCDDRALLCNELYEEIKNLSQSSSKCVIIVGDGAEIFYKVAKELNNVKKAHPSREFQNAVGVGYAALNGFETGNTLTPNELLPFYLRLPQAERELKMKKEN